MAVVWVTGARGFIGRHVARALAAGGDTVAGIGHGIWPQREAADWGVSHWLNGEIEAANLESLRRTAGEPRAVFHLAGGSAVGPSLSNPFEDFSRTVLASARLLEWLRLAAPGAKLVAVSSAAVYGSQFAGPVPPGAPVRPYSPYGHHKLMMEQLCRSYGESFGLRCTVIRLFSVYGPWLRKQLLWDLCTRLAAGESPIRLGGTGRELRDWTEIDDVARLLLRAEALEGAPGETLDGGSGTGTPVAAIAAGIAGAWGSGTPIEFSGSSRPGDPFSLVADAAATRPIGFDWRVPVADGLARYVDWFRGAAG